MREIRYRTIAEDLRGRIAEGALAAGAVLPSEADLAAQYAVSRVTVRKALDVLRDEGRVAARQGFGWYVAGEPVRQQLVALDTIESQLSREGRCPSRRVRSFRFVDAPPAAAAELGPGTVLEVERLSLADGRPFALVTVWCPEALGSGLSRDDVEDATFQELLDVDLGGATQTIGASVATPEEAVALEVPEGSPLLVCRRISRDAAGAPVLFAVHRFPAHLTEFVVELPSVGESIAPTGLRLLSGVDDP